MSKKQQLIFVLKPATRSEIGVFATQDIAKGTYLPLFFKGDYKLRSRKKIAKLPEPTRLAVQYCVLDEAGYHGPANWNQMSIGYFMRHATKPSAGNRGRNYTKYYATHDISAGEEMTLDMRTLGDERYI